MKNRMNIGSTAMWSLILTLLVVFICASSSPAETTSEQTTSLPENTATSDSTANLVGPVASMKALLKSEEELHQNKPKPQPTIRREDPFVYSSRGRRDAFRPLITDSKKGEEIKTDLLQLEGAILTGVVWSGGEYLAMVKDKDGRSFFLRQGDDVYRGKVITVTQTKAVFQLVEFGEVERITLSVRSNQE
jgi:hypothetical protein